MKTKWMLAGLLLVFGATAQAVVTVQNTVAAQTPGTKIVTIGYDVSSDYASTVNITLRAFDGETELMLSSLSGNVGAGVGTGAGKIIVWDAGADWYGQHTAGLKFVVLADDGESMTPFPVEGAVVVQAGTIAGTDPDFGAFSLTLSGSLYVDETEITKADWDFVYNWAVTNGYDFQNEGSAVSNNHPVSTVSWYDSVKWCNARSEIEGLEPCYTAAGTTYKTGSEIPDLNPGATGYRLPTTEEWEYVARGGADTRYPFGNQITHDHANFFSYAEGGFHPAAAVWPYTLPAGSFAPNAYGLYDVSGNVAEWCWDESADDGNRYLRGGSWIDGADAARCADAFVQLPHNSTVYDGFRTVRSASGSVSGTAVTWVDARDYTLTVISQSGTSTPAPGYYVYAWGTSTTCSVDPVVIASDTVYISKGWTGSGSIPATGTATSTGNVDLTDTQSTIVWHWLADNDYDDLPNDWEWIYSGSETGVLASADQDGDGYTAAEEFLLGTDPTNGVSQLNLTVAGTTNGTSLISCSTMIGRTYTIEYAGSLASPDWKPLIEFAGTGAVVEYEDTGAATNRFYRLLVHGGAGIAYAWRQPADTDGDELPNQWELDYFASPEGANASLDSDFDGYSNLSEYWLGSDPTNSASHLNFEVQASGNGTALISSSTAPGRVYTIEYTDSLTAVEWRLLGGYVGTGASGQYEDTAYVPGRYYRMSVVIPPGVEL